MNNIILIGMPTCGKSTLGVLLAKTLGYGFIDSDLMIQSQEKSLLSDIIAKKGIDEFSRIEDDVNANIWAERCVIATGGSVVYGEKAMRHLKELGKIVYIKISFEEVEKRLKNIVTRGVVMKEGKTLLDLYNERIPLYEKYADVTVDCDGNDMEKSLEAIIEKLKQ